MQCVHACLTFAAGCLVADRKRTGQYQTVNCVHQEQHPTFFVVVIFFYFFYLWSTDKDKAMMKMRRRKGKKMDLKRGSRKKKKNNMSTTARATTTVRHNEPKRKTRLTLCVNVCGYLLVVDVVRAATFFF